MCVRLPIIINKKSVVTHLLAVRLYLVRGVGAVSFGVSRGQLQPYYHCSWRQITRDSRRHHLAPATFSFWPSRCQTRLSYSAFFICPSSREHYLERENLLLPPSLPILFFTYPPYPFHLNLFSPLFIRSVQQLISSISGVADCRRRRVPLFSRYVKSSACLIL